MFHVLISTASKHWESAVTSLLNSEMYSWIPLAYWCYIIQWWWMISPSNFRYLLKQEQREHQFLWNPTKQGPRTGPLAPDHHWKRGKLDNNMPFTPNSQSQLIHGWWYQKLLKGQTDQEEHEPPYSSLTPARDQQKAWTMPFLSDIKTWNAIERNLDNSFPPLKL